MGEGSSAGEIPRRIQVINNERPNLEVINQQWMFLTEATRREMLEKADVRKALIKFCSSPVSEDLPKDLVDSVGKIEPRIERLAKRFTDESGKYLDLPTLPDEQIETDVMHSPETMNVDETVDRLKRLYGEGTPDYKEQLEFHIKDKSFTRGLTRGEKGLILTRLRYARDVKILALGAEMLEQGDSLKPNENKEIELPSGTKIHISSEDQAVINDLLRPQLWEMRREKKDRVHEVVVGGRRYILKERKTNRHRDMKKEGHADGKTSFEEIETAEVLNKNAEIIDGETKLSWEKPIGSVEFPDGFQFALFQHEGKMIREDDIRPALFDYICNHPSQYDLEYQEISKLAQDYLNRSDVANKPDTEPLGKLDALLVKTGFKKPIVPKLSFRDYARVKALRLERRSNQICKMEKVKQGFGDREPDGYEYKIIPGETNDKHATVEVVSYDFEYYEDLDEERKQELGNSLDKSYRERENQRGIGDLSWHDSMVSKIQRAAYFALLKKEGILEEQPSQK